jgi:hypothetical protein
MNRLPAEIWQAVFDCLEPDAATLMKVAHACRAFLPLAHERLFRTITLSSADDCRRLLHVLEHNSSLAAHVRHLRLDNTSGHYQLWYFLFLSVEGRTLAALLSHIAHLELQAFSFREKLLGLGFASFFASYCALRSLTMSECAFDSAAGMLTFITQFSGSLQYLGLIHMTWGTLESAASNSDKQDAKLPMLSKMKVFGVFHPTFPGWIVQSSMADQLCFLELNSETTHDQNLHQILLPHVCETLEHLVLDTHGPQSRIAASSCKSPVQYIWCAHS